MKIKKYFLFLILLTSSVFSNTTKEELAKELVEIYEVEKIINKWIPHVKDHISRFTNKQESEVFKKVTSVYIKMYSEVYEKAELQALVDFYKSDIGMAIYKKDEIIFTKSLERIQDIIPLLKKNAKEIKSKQTISLAVSNTTKEELAKELVEIYEVEKTINKWIPQIKRDLSVLTGKQGSEALIDEVLKSVFQSIDYKKLTSLYIKIYSEVYEKAELQALVDFYKSDIGMAIYKKDEIIFTKSLEVIQDITLLLLKENAKEIKSK